jgi:hypothetical protein
MLHDDLLWLDLFQRSNGLLLPLEWQLLLLHRAARWLSRRGLDSMQVLYFAVCRGFAHWACSTPRWLL